MNITVFCGAGFSAQFGHPVMGSFLRYLDDNNVVNEEQRELLNTLVLEARSAASFLGGAPQNLEDILSFAVMGDRLEFAGGGQGRADRVRRILRRVYTHVRGVEEYWSRYDGLDKFLGVELRSSQHGLSFITTNYDINLESAIVRFGQRCDPGIENISYVSDNLHGGTSDHFYQKGGIPLLKLHGSVNWFEDSSELETIKVDARVVRVMGNIERTGNKEIPYVCTDDYTDPAAPLLVPPSFLKSDLPKPLKIIWSRAAKVLGGASMVIFVGYSFPQTDTEMRYFLARALTANANLREIIIVDPLAKEIVERLRSPLGGFGDYFGKMLTPVAHRWVDVYIDRKTWTVRPFRERP